MQSRREFLKRGAVLAFSIFPGCSQNAYEHEGDVDILPARSTVYRALNGSPEQNMTMILEMMGPIEKLIDSDDVVVVKPNVQWWNQGAPNLSALKTFVDSIMNRRGGFNGEVVIAENCHRGRTPWKSLNSGWLPFFERNSNIPGVKNMNELSALMKEKYGFRFSVVHWVDVMYGGKRVVSPKDGEGYVYCDGSSGTPLLACDNGAPGSRFRSTIMTYPIFSTDRGTIIDFKNGLWEKGEYIDRRLRLVNFSALNHHSTYCGATSAVKNYMGISDLSAGPDPYNGGRLVGNYYNFHSFPFNKWASGPLPGMLGKEIGVFMRTVRRADVNITTAEWVGLSSRVDAPVARTRAVLASTDPVALDYHATKYVLYPNSGITFHNPKNRKSPVRDYLLACSNEGGGVFDEGSVAVQSYDFKKGRRQENGRLKVAGQVEWGSNLKGITKYLFVKYFLSKFS